MASNFSIYSIPVYWIISLFPHAYAGAVMKKANNNKWNNVNPRGIETSANYKQSVPSDVWERFERAEAAHKNSMENAPFFIGAVVVGNMAGLDTSTMNKFTGAVLALRVLYTVLYINTTTRKKSFFRSLSWGGCLALVIGLYVKAGNAWAAKMS